MSGIQPTPQAPKSLSLLQAVQQNDVAGVTSLLKQKRDPQACREAIVWAMGAGKLAMLKLFLQQGVKLEKARADDWDWESDETWYGEESAYRLIFYGFGLLGEEVGTLRPYNWYLARKVAYLFDSPLITAIRRGHVDVVSFLLQPGQFYYDKFSQSQARNCFALAWFARLSNFSLLNPQRNSIVLPGGLVNIGGWSMAGSDPRVREGGYSALRAIDNFFCHLTTLKKTQLISSDAFPVANLALCEQLDLAHNKLGNEAVAWLVRWFRMQLPSEHALSQQQLLEQAELSSVILNFPPLTPPRQFLGAHIPALTSLNLSHNEIGNEQDPILGRSEGSIPLAKALAQSPLYECNLSSNCLNSEDAIAWAQLASSSQTLTHLDLSHNSRIGERGARALLQAFKDNERLQTVKLSLTSRNLVAPIHPRTFAAIQELNVKRHLPVLPAESKRKSAQPRLSESPLFAGTAPQVEEKKIRPEENKRRETRVFAEEDSPIAVSASGVFSACIGGRGAKKVDPAVAKEYRRAARAGDEKAAQQLRRLQLDRSTDTEAYYHQMMLDYHLIALMHSGLLSLNTEKRQKNLEMVKRFIEDDLFEEGEKLAYLEVFLAEYKWADYLPRPAEQGHKDEATLLKLYALLFALAKQYENDPIQQGLCARALAFIPEQKHASYEEQHELDLSRWLKSAAKRIHDLQATFELTTWPDADKTKHFLTELANLMQHYAHVPQDFQSDGEPLPLYMQGREFLEHYSHLVRLAHSKTLLPPALYRALLALTVEWEQQAFLQLPEDRTLQIQDKKEAFIKILRLRLKAMRIPAASVYSGFGKAEAPKTKGKQLLNSVLNLGSTACQAVPVVGGIVKIAVATTEVASVIHDIVKVTEEIGKAIEVAKLFEKHSDTVRAWLNKRSLEDRLKCLFYNMDLWSDKAIERWAELCYQRYKSQINHASAYDGELIAEGIAREVLDFLMLSQFKITDSPYLGEWLLLWCSEHPLHEGARLKSFDNYHSNGLTVRQVLQTPGRVCHYMPQNDQSVQEVKFSVLRTETTAGSVVDCGSVVASRWEVDWFAEQLKFRACFPKDDKDVDVRGSSSTSHSAGSFHLRVQPDCLNHYMDYLGSFSSFLKIMKPKKLNGKNKTSLSSPALIASQLNSVASEPVHHGSPLQHTAAAVAALSSAAAMPQPKHPSPSIPQKEELGSELEAEASPGFWYY